MINLVSELIEMALEEDIGTGDITTDSLIPFDASGKGIIVAKEDIILAGLDVARLVFERLDPRIRFGSMHRDGDEIVSGEQILQVEGSLRALLKGERVALNFLQRLSGVATNVRSYVKALEKFSIRLVDTRKTTPGFRILEKYAVRIGGANNHRMGLFDGVLIKDNHITACGSIKKAVESARKDLSHLMKIEVEVSDLAGVREALSAGADIIMLDNMDIAHIREAVSVIQGRALVEVSGGITLRNIKDIACTGVDMISVGALTHSARAVDLSMRIQE